ncbi:MAG: hypothetical protein ACXU9P_14045 [Thermodesulfobacteriota bacterium]
MGEIKSTLELAMERTKKFALSDKDKEEIKQKEVLQKAGSLFHRYGDGHLSLNEVLKQIEKMDEKTATAVKQSLLSQWIDALSLNDGHERTFKGMESLKRQSLDEVRKKFQHLLSQYQAEKEKVKEKMRIQLAEALKEKGIYGSAVEPNFEKSDLWKKENEKLDHSYREKLEEIKEELRAL